LLLGGLLLEKEWASPPHGGAPQTRGQQTRCQVLGSVTKPDPTRQFGQSPAGAVPEGHHRSC